MGVENFKKNYKFNWMVLVYGMSILFPCFILYMVATQWVDLPRFESWNHTLVIMQKYYHHKMTLNDFIVPVNCPHRDILLIVFFFVDYVLFAASRFPLLMVHFANQLLLLLVMAVYVKRLVPFSSKQYSILLIIFSAILFAPQMRDIWVWPYTIEYTLVEVFFVSAIFSLKQQYQSYHEFILPIVLGILASLSSANGLVIWPVFVMLLLIDRAPLRYVVGMMLVGALTIALYKFQNPYLSTGILNPHQPFVHRIYYFFAFIGSLFSAGADGVAGVMGFVGVILFALCGSHVVFSGRISQEDRRQLFKWLAISALAIASGVIAAYGRLDKSIGQALTTRYLPLTMPFWCSLSAPLPASSQLHTAMAPYQ